MYGTAISIFAKVEYGTLSTKAFGLETVEICAAIVAASTPAIQLRHRLANLRAGFQD